jgi:hypothetical protein
LKAIIKRNKRVNHSVRLLSSGSELLNFEVVFSQNTNFVFSDSESLSFYSQARWLS